MPQVKCFAWAAHRTGNDLTYFPLKIKHGHLQAGCQGGSGNQFFPARFRPPGGTAGGNFFHSPRADLPLKQACCRLLGRASTPWPHSGDLFDIRSMS